MLDTLTPITISRFNPDREVFGLLALDVIPALASRASVRGRDGLEVWSAGCAPGEEPYTLAIIWELELAARFPGLAIRILATDIHPAMIERAHRCRFTAASLKRPRGELRKLDALRSSTMPSVSGALAGEIAIGLLGDLMLGRGVATELERCDDPAQLWDPELRALVSTLDVVICNLECAISTRGARTALIEGKPFFFRAPPQAVQALKAIGVRAVTLANNHALDFGPAALAETVKLLSASGIEVTGAGPDRDSARCAAVVEVAGQHLAVVSATDHPPEYAATPSSWGVAYAALRDGPPQWLVHEIGAARARGELVIAFPHWGPNMVVRPAQWQRRTAACIQDAGCDLVAGHSAHLFGGVRWTRAGPVLYDLGDALDDYAVDPSLRNDLGVLAIWRPGAGALELVGLRLHYAHTGLAHDADADWIATRLQQACRELSTSVRRIGEQRFHVEASVSSDGAA